MSSLIFIGNSDNKESTETVNNASNSTNELSFNDKNSSGIEVPAPSTIASHDIVVENSNCMDHPPQGKNI